MISVPVKSTAAMKKYTDRYVNGLVLNYPVIVSVLEDNILVGRSEKSYNLSNPVDVTKLQLCMHEGKMKVATQISNVSKQDVGASLIVEDGGNLIKEETIDIPRVASGNSETVYLDISDDANFEKTANLKMVLKPQIGDLIKIGRKFSGYLQVPYADTAPKIDGIIGDEWENAGVFKLTDEKQVVQMLDWGGIEDCSGIGKIMWDKDNLYIAVDVTDDIHSQPYSGTQIWSGDCIQLGVACDRANPNSSDGYNELGFALNDDSSKSAYRWTASSGFKSGDFNDAIYEISRNGNKTCYEIAIPWKAISSGKTISENSDIAFSLLIADDDGNGRDGWIEYQSGIGNAKDVTAYGDLLLVK